jgi:Alpha/beta hydrolase of unknown function (DUF900)
MFDEHADQPGASGTTAGARPAASADAQEPPPVLATEVRELVTLLKQTAKETKSKDPWDKFAAVSTFVSSVIIALIGLYFTHSYNQAESARRALQEARQQQINELDVVAKFMPYLTGTDEQAKVTSIATIKALAGIELATVMAELHPSIGTAKGLEAIAESAASTREDRNVAAAAADKIYGTLPQIRVFYATDRSPVSDKGHPYGPNRGPMSFGRALVSIPPSHRLGSIEQPSIFRLELREDPDRHVTLRTATEVQSDTFVAELKDILAAMKLRRVMVYVHGFNVTFAQAVLRQAQIAHDLLFDGPALLFSWPSRAELMGYVQDQANVEAARPHFAEFLLLLQKLDAEVHLIGHGLGCRLIVGALADYSSRAGTGGAKIHSESRPRRPRHRS